MKPLAKFTAVVVLAEPPLRLLITIVFTSLMNLLFWNIYMLNNKTRVSSADLVDGHNKLFHRTRTIV